MTYKKTAKTGNSASPQTNRSQKNRPQNHRAQNSRTQNHRTQSRRTQKSNSAAPDSSIMPLLLVVIFIAGLIGAAQQHMLPYGIAGMYLTLSLLTFIAYAIDKSAAKRGKWRTKESTLHLLALMGGWPGALFAQNLLRHKSVKASFRNVFWLTVVANLAVLGYGIKTGAVDMFI
ncbi:DUF1294 domain-containing protein [Shewanella oneidensis]|uniref:DUF1294 domain-containing protein n=1 Tax=Shewanella oneidensis (strain ATCC 700550 / JCM 31522 / CIP 106686 / LMG 19005 / NCIMB 14063 / MR-1) TaxID=211586 RepID=Q8EH36_SHEON|nr:DUF1294 domain-containing protein [Shewanella oneidensis]AAN54460.2 membrane protein of unknown function DUF1294 [Shewanella oneidensis MR-1]MDX5996771.1 DUF1294 domain-containing protein [Shewanella oneidensis]MEE2028687.1 hypothetical protein [Shewanella oneidensis]